MNLKLMFLKFNMEYCLLKLHDCTNKTFSLDNLIVNSLISHSIKGSSILESVTVEQWLDFFFSKLNNSIEKNILDVRFC